MMVASKKRRPAEGREGRLFHSASVTILSSHLRISLSSAQSRASSGRIDGAYVKRLSRRRETLPRSNGTAATKSTNSKTCRTARNAPSPSLPVSHVRARDAHVRDARWQSYRRGVTLAHAAGLHEHRSTFTRLWGVQLRRGRQLRASMHFYMPIGDIHRALIRELNVWPLFYATKTHRELCVYVGSRIFVSARNLRDARAPDTTSATVTEGSLLIDFMASHVLGFSCVFLAKA